MRIVHSHGGAFWLNSCIKFPCFALLKNVRCILLNTCETAKFRVNKRSVRERFKLIKKKFKRTIPQEETLSGIEVEPSLQLRQALEEICSLEESFPVEEKESKFHAI